MTTTWQVLCAALQARHRPDAAGLCMACSDAHGHPVQHPCAITTMAEPVVAAPDEEIAVYRAFLPHRAPGLENRAPT